jgi:hypothetical protein
MGPHVKEIAAAGAPAPRHHGGAWRIRPEYLSRPAPARRSPQPATGAEDASSFEKAPVLPGPGRVPPGLEAVYLPRADVVEALEWHPVVSLLDLARAVFYTAKDHRDIQQAALPSYRERVVTVRLRADEGGINLSMPQAVIEEVMQLGGEAGRRLRDQFDFDQHRWVRFLVIMSQLERELTAMVSTFGTDTNYQRLLVPGARAGFPFPRADDWCAQAESLIERIRKFLVDAYHRQPKFFDDDHIPIPQPVKRLVPQE